MSQYQALFAFLLIGLIVVALLGSAIYLRDRFKTLLSSRLHLRDGAPFWGRIRSEYRAVLQAHFPYYQLLGPADRNRFEQRVQRFIDHKQFIARSVPVVTAEMKALVAACAVQLTFGLPPIVLQHFTKILLYEDDYYSTINRAHHKGEVNPRLGIIVLSWRSFVEGYIDVSDSLNLGLHEMAHALHFENRIFNGEHNFLQPQLLHVWEQLAAYEIAEMRAGTSDFFRSYAASNSWEFFAVAVEAFFENSEQMSREKPELYHCLGHLLNQDPSRLLKRQA